MKILGTICARGGSKGIKNKNIILLQGKPLIYYSIMALKKWKNADRIICSTDTVAIQKIAQKYGAETPFIRPPHLATDDASKLDVLKHLVLYCENKYKILYEYIVDLDPTSPLRKIEDIDCAFNKFIRSNADILISVYKAYKNPYFNMVELDKENFAHLVKSLDENIISRQQAPAVYSMNASIYIYKRDYLLNTSRILDGKVIIYEMSEISIDIDKKLDFDFIEYILKEGKYKFDY